MNGSTGENVVLGSAYHIVSHSEHVKVNRAGIETAAAMILASISSTPYTPSSWGLVPLHPMPSKRPPKEILNWIFLVSSLNFSFWSDLPANERFGVIWTAGVDGKCAGEEKKCFTGYFSLLVCLHRALHERLPILDPQFWKSGSEAELRNAFRSDQAEEMPLLDERIRVLREIGSGLCSSYNGSYASLIKAANGSALKLVELVVETFPCYDDQGTFAGESVFLRKRAQILVAETWAAFEGVGYGYFHDIDQLTMFADYRVPQILHSLKTLDYSPTLTAALESLVDLPNGSQMEVEIRGASIVVIEEIRVQIRKMAASQGLTRIALPNAVLLDFLLWDLAKAEETQALLPHHRTRSIFY